MPNFHSPDLGSAPDSPFARDETGKLVRRMYWLDMGDRSVVLAMTQGIGTALNEEYIYNDKGVLENAGFLDYRIPVASDVPFINTEIVEVPNPDHPYGVRGIGEVPIIPPLPAIANAIHDAVGVRMRDHPMSPPKVLKALKDQMIEDAAGQGTAAE